MRQRFAVRASWTCLLALFGMLGLAPTARADVRKSTLRVAQAAPSNDDRVAKAVVKAFGALVLHQASKPQPGDANDFFKTAGRALAAKGRDELIESALQDLSPTSKVVERAAVRGLVVLALDGKLTHDRDRVLNYLRRTNPGMADSVEITEFLIRLAQAVDKSR